MKRALILKVIIVVMLIYLLPQFLYSQEEITRLEVPDLCPILLQDIPDQEIVYGFNLTDAFVLTDYLVDSAGFPMNYSFSNVTDIIIEIANDTTVSFYPDTDLTENRTVIFYGDDGNCITPSNNVTIYFSNDQMAPQWRSPAKSRSKIYQNSLVNFTTIWTDNFQLLNYVFMINEGAGYFTSSPVEFSGKQNVSFYSLTISSPGGLVYWMFCANDTSFNTNCTDLQTFNVSVRDSTTTPPTTTPPPSGGGSGGGGGSGITGEATSSSSGGTTILTELLTRRKLFNFTVEPLYFQVSVKKGTTETRILKITNIGTSDLYFNLSVRDISNIVKLSEETINLSAGEEKRITVDFSGKEGINPDQYFGRIIVDSVQIIEVPVVVDINDLETGLEIDVVVGDEYKRVNPGEDVFANITIKNKKDITPEKLVLYRAIKDFYGNIYDSKEEEIENQNIIQMYLPLNVPEDTPIGDYIYYSRVSLGNASSIDSDVFEVGYRFKYAGYIKSSLFFLLIVILSVIVVALVLRYKREKEKERILSLYLMVNELKTMINDKQYERAVDLYIRIKSAYGEKVSKSALLNRDKLKEEIKKLSGKLKDEVMEIDQEKTENSDKDSVKEKEAEKKDNVDIKSEKNEKSEEVKKEEGSESKVKIDKKEEVKGEIEVGKVEESKAKESKSEEKLEIKAEVKEVKEEKINLKDTKEEIKSNVNGNKEVVKVDSQKIEEVKVPVKKTRAKRSVKKKDDKI